MIKTFANIVRRLVNGAGILCVVFGGMSAARSYSSLYAIATTGSAPTGIPLTDLPATIDTPLLTMLLGLLLLELGDFLWRRYMRSNNPFKVTPDGASQLNR